MLQGFKVSRLQTDRHSVHWYMYPDDVADT